MNEYLLSVIGIVLFSSVLIAVLPSGKTGVVIRGIARIACVITILSPVVHFFVDAGELDGFFREKGIETEVSFIEYCSKERIEEAEEMLKKELSEKYEGVEKVELQWKNEAIYYGGYTASGVKIERIFVYLNKEMTNSACEEMIEYLFNQYGCEGQVVYLEKMVE